MGGRRELLVLMLVSVPSIGRGPTVSVGPAAAASSARDSGKWSFLRAHPCKAVGPEGAEGVVLTYNDVFALT